MAYKITKGFIIPQDKVISEVEKLNQSTNFPEVTTPILNNISIGARVVRKIRPFEIGIVERIFIDTQNNIKNLWIKFSNKSPLPYPPDDIEQIVLQ